MADDLDPAAVAMVREHYRVECLLDDPKTRLYRSHVGILLDALAAARAGEPTAPTVSAEQVEAGLWAWIESATEGVTRENINPRVLDRNRPRMAAAFRAAGIEVREP